MIQPEITVVSAVLDGVLWNRSVFFLAKFRYTAKLSHRAKNQPQEGVKWVAQGGVGGASLRSGRPVYTMGFTPDSDTLSERLSTEAGVTLGFHRAFDARLGQPRSFAGGRIALLAAQDRDLFISVPGTLTAF